MRTSQPSALASAFQRAITDCSAATCSSLVNGASCLAESIRAESSSPPKIARRAFSDSDKADGSS